MGAGETCWWSHFDIVAVGKPFGRVELIWHTQCVADEKAVDTTGYSALLNYHDCGKMSYIRHRFAEDRSTGRE
jgi:hypothetical protein